MSVIYPNNKETLFLPAGQILTLANPSGSAGLAVRLSRVPGGGDSQSVTALAGSDVTFGPWSAPERFDVSCTTGTVTATMASVDPATISYDDEAAALLALKLNKSQADPTILQIAEKTPVNGVAASGVVTFTGTPVADEHLVIGTQTFHFVAARAGAGSFEITISANNTTQADNMKAAVNADVSNVTVDNIAGVATVTAAVKGTSGNLIVLSTNATGTAVSSVTAGKLDGGINGTVGVANETCTDATYLYHAIAANTIADSNWRRVALGTAY